MLFKTITSILLLLCLVSEVRGENFPNYNSYDSELQTVHIDKIVSNEEGVFLFVQDKWIRVESMQATPGNILILNNSLWTPLASIIECDNYYTWKCPICGWTNPQGVSRCLNWKNH